MIESRIIIIGAGPAGITAAIQLRRYGLPCIVLEKERVGGLLWNANLLENYPGFPVGVSGPKLASLMEQQAKRIGVQINSEEVIRVANNSDPAFKFYIRTDRNEYASGCLVIASGTKPRSTPFNIPMNCAERVLSEVHPLLGERGKKIVIIGAGDAAFDYALSLVKKGNSVTILNRGREVKCMKLLWDRVMANSAIKYRSECCVIGFEAEKVEGGLKVRCASGEAIAADYLLYAIGRVPQVDFLSKQLSAHDCPGLYHIGDVKNGLYRQAAIAAGEGLRAAMDIYFNMETRI